MTEFTKEFTAEQPEIINDESLTWRDYEKRATCHYPEALDEIQRLQERVAELECQLKSKKIVIESKEQTIREFAEKMLDLRKR